MEYIWTYLLMSVILSVIWFCLFFWRKDNREEMFLVSCIFAFFGLLLDIVYIQDWWRPLSILGSPLGPESLLTGFFTGGIASVLYEDFFKKTIKPTKKRKFTKEEEMNLVILLAVPLVLFFSSFFMLRLNSFVSTVLAAIFPISYMWWKRNDLIVDSIVSGILLLLCSMLVYNILQILTPGWIDAFWYFKNVPHIIIIGVPIDDVVWYLLGGMYVGPLYEFWKEAKLVNIKKKNK